MTEVRIDGESLTFEQVLAVAYGMPGETRVSISDAAKANVNRAAAAVAGTATAPATAAAGCVARERPRVLRVAGDAGSGIPSEPV